MISGPKIPSIDTDRLRAAYQKVRDELMAERTPGGHWVGQLSSSALSTATAISALAVVKAATSGRGVQDSESVVGLENLDGLIDRGAAWLLQQQNPDGGFGDTDLSYSNIATTYLVVAALHLAGAANQHQELIKRANAYIDSKGRLQGLRDRYGIDKTFVVPIMTNLALAGLVDWREIDPLPFELACIPQAWYRFVGMPVVSYAIPALVAIGQAHYYHAPPKNPITRLIRLLSVNRSLNILRRMQPESGGYLEATPLTSFVVMSLASIPFRSQPADQVIRDGVKFLVNSMRADGSWPIDTNLATWNTTLAIKALAGAGEDVAALLGPHCLDWLLACQHTKRHPFTGASPGGFGWSDLSGAVPDADDTPGAMLALAMWAAVSANGPNCSKCANGYLEGLYWLQYLQNADGGWPTFCKGWGRLPFDRSGADLTAHVVRAIELYRRFDDIFGRDSVPRKIHSNVYHATRGNEPALRFLVRKQHADGSWSPLWFGNQDDPNEENHVYGTAKVLMAYRDLGLMESPEAQRGVAWLVANQNNDGGWGSGVWGKVRGTKDEGRSGNAEMPNRKSQIQNLKSSLEETALAVEALLAACPLSPDSCPLAPAAAAVARGSAWLIERVENNQHRQPAPIGFYFAKLWYYEKLYPLTFTVAALGRARRQFGQPPASTHIAEPASTDAP